MRCTSLLLLVTLFLLALPGCAPKLSPVITVLEPVERELSGAEAQSHKIILAADKNFRIEVEQIGIDAGIEVRDSEGQNLVTVNSPTARVGSESVLLQTKDSGTYQVLVRSNEHAKKKGRYRLTIEELRNETRSDKRRLKAEEAMTEAARLNFEIAGASDSDAIEKLRADAIEQYEIAQSEWHNLRSIENEAWALYYMAVQHYELYEWKLAAASAKDAASLFRGSEDSTLLANALQRQGMALIETHEKEDFRTALDAFARALDIQQANGSLYQQANTINYIGLAYFQQGELAQARERFVKASDMFAAQEEIQQALWTSNNIAVADQMSGNYRKAVETYKDTLKLAVSEESAQVRALMLDNLAIAYAVLGDLQNALLTYRNAAEVFEALGDRLGKARALYGTGFTYGRLGDWKTALGFFEQALALQQGPAENRALAKTYMNIGNAHRNLGRPTEGLKAHNQSLALSKLPAEKANAYIELGRDYTAKGDYSAAISQFDRALEYAKGDEAAIARAFALQERGQLKVQQGADVRGGLTDLQEALLAHRAMHSEAGEAQAMQAMARAEHKLGHVAKAIEHAAKALDITETLRIRVGSPNLRLSFTGLQLPTYELHIELLMELANSRSGKTSEHAPNYAALALEVSERARARSLVEVLTEVRTDDRQGIDAALIRARNEKRQELVGLAYRVEMLVVKGSSSLDDMQKTLQSTQADLDIIEARIRKQNRQYAELTEPRFLAAEDIQGLLASTGGEDIQTILLEYSLGEKQSFLWSVTTDSIESFVLPGRAEIETAAREVYDKLKTLDVDSSSRKAAQRASAKLADLVLAPALHQLEGRRVVVVPDGALQYIPFGILPILRPDGSSAPLLAHHQVATLPSAATLAVLRKAQQGRERASKSIAIFADPVFNEQDSRLAGSMHTERHASARSAEEAQPKLFRLPASGEEADAIASLADRDLVLKATGFDANRAEVLNSPLADYRIIHFATHGLINSEYPELSALALSAFDKNGKPQPGFLRLHDIYSLRLNADLVVLSACEAALGKDIRGEGLFGLTRGFMYAGAPSVVASLWRASDEATAELMQKFYRLMLKQGLLPADALRKAQLAISRQHKWRDPYYWAGFVLQGDWR